jgi:chorismate dehydratase
MHRTQVGHIQYINTYPLFYNLMKERGTLPFNLVSDIPSRLNAMMREGELDASFISSFEYAAASENYLIQPDICLASTGYVNSVLLISTRDIEDLDGADIGLSNASATSSNLIRILLKEFYGFSNTFHYISYREKFHVSLKNHDAILIIGDEALQFNDHATCKVYDIGQLWTEKTGFPIVFALFVINTRSAKTCKKELDLLFAKINESHTLFKEHPEVIAQFAREHSELSINYMDYYSNLTYTFTDELKEALVYYYRMLEKCSIIKDSVQLRFY